MSFKKLLASIFYLLCLTFVGSSFAGPVEYYYSRMLESKQQSISPSSTEEKSFSQIIDHDDPSQGVFIQRYFIDESYGKTQDAPVFFYLCGEWTCSEHDLDGAIRSYAKKHHAKLIAIEHRYYGKSIPFNSLSSHDMRYLTTDQALADLAYFQKTIRSKKQWTGKWVVFGGSYPGSLSAYYRLKHPNLVVGSLASSAPVQAKEDFFEYDAHVTKVAGPECALHIQSVVNEVEDAYANNPQRFAEIKELFLASEVEHPIDFIYLLADIGATAVQYGQKDTFCNLLATASTPIEGYAAAAHFLYETMGVNAVQLTPQGLMSENPEDYDKQGTPGFRQWYYQSCTEYGYWQNANSDRTQSTRSSHINLNYHQELCKRLFDLKERADTSHINNNYYLPLIHKDTSRIYFTNGEEDPWSKLSITTENGNATNPKLSYKLIKKAAHCKDLHAPNANDSHHLIAARNTMNRLLLQWLKDETR